MLQTILNAFKVPEIRRKLAFTAAMLLLYRLGAYIPAPGIDLDSVKDIESNFAGNNILGFLNLFSGGSLSRLSLFALGIMPYITASIILQLMTVVVPSLVPMISMVPPAFSIFPFAVALKAWTRTVSFFVSSPRPSTFTGWRRLASPAARRLSGVTSAPAAKRASRSATLTGCVWVRNCSKGIDILRRGPRSFRVRMWIGFCPPS